MTSEPGVTMDSGFPIKPVDEPPATPPHYAGHTPGYGPNPTAQGVRGYRDLPAEDVALINAVKELQENVANVWAAIYLREGTDRRWAEVAQLHLEEGVSALVRSVAQPHDPFAAALDRLLGTATSEPKVSTEDAPERPGEQSTEDGTA